MTNRFDRPKTKSYKEGFKAGQFSEQKKTILAERIRYAKMLKDILEATKGQPQALYVALESVLKEIEKYLSEPKKEAKK
jgi:hypothetical protein